MPEGVGYSGSNVVAGTGLQLNYVGDHVFGYSGAITMASSATEYSLLEFTTGNKPIKAWVDFRNVTLNTNNNTTSKWYMNDILVFQVESESSETAFPGHVGRLIIPPYTSFKQTGQADGSNIIVLGIFTGKVLQ
jgi:hypothetical protein